MRRRRSTHSTYSISPTVRSTWPTHAGRPAKSPGTDARAGPRPVPGEQDRRHHSLAGAAAPSPVNPDRMTSGLRGLIAWATAHNVEVARRTPPGLNRIEAQFTALRTSRSTALTTLATLSRPA